MKKLLTAKLLFVACSIISVDAMAFGLPVPSVVEASCKLEGDGGTLIGRVYRTEKGRRYARFEGGVQKSMGFVERDILREFKDSIKNLLATLNNLQLNQVSYVEHYRMKRRPTDEDSVWLVARDHNDNVLGQVIKLDQLTIQCD